ncbi:cell division protein FtsQ/DivIB [Roseospira goensis]|uniref:Cell division protein FtsQ n=1 Tax=Roseospira goensis TaxID=391922 RepID=A0A7W6S0J1_9PROT|nr:cell division protein FtsQ/DivIB [Roseospira goensis]MBB4286655.1 cell division protein FtsQ [Roseospira goensis]
MRWLGLGPSRDGPAAPSRGRSTGGAAARGAKAGRTGTGTKGTGAKGSGAKGSGAKAAPKTTARGAGRRMPARRTRPSGAALWRGARLGAGFLLLLALSGGAAWVWQSGIVGRQVAAAGEALERFAARGGLVVRSVTVEGRVRTDPTRLLAALRTGRGEPILGFDPHAARTRVEALPWVAGARVERRLPDAIHVVLTEREPLALWQRAPDGDFAVIDRTGVPVEVDTRPYADLPVIVGRDAPAAVPALMALLATEPDLARRVRAATRVAGRRWTLRLDDIETGIDVRLPEGDPAAAWRRLAQLERDARLLARDIEVVDLRLPDRLVVRPRTAPEPGPGAPSTATGTRRVPVSGPGQET